MWEVQRRWYGALQRSQMRDWVEVAFKGKWQAVQGAASRRS